MASVMESSTVEPNLNETAASNATEEELEMRWLRTAYLRPLNTSLEQFEQVLTYLHATVAASGGGAGGGGNVSQEQLLHGDDSPLRSEDFYSSYNCHLGIVTMRDAIAARNATFCSQSWDGILCWPWTSAGSIAAERCPLQSQVKGFAYRHCNEAGIWAPKTNYNECLVGMPPEFRYPPTDEIREIVPYIANIMFVCSMMSLICLAITLFIFCYFKSLQCSRISIHKNLAVAFLIRFVFQLVFIEPYFSQRPKSYRDIDWLCKTLTTLNLFSMMASIFWMFVEGLFLHNRIAVSVFDTEAPFLLFYFIGWGLPSVFTVTWALVRELAYTNEVEVDLKRYINDEECWGGDFEGRASTWILVAPAMLVLVVNLIFLVNIIRILVTKLRANNARESEAAQWRKAIKATAILLPLLGITNLLFFYNPKDKGPMEKAYLFINALLQNSQGIFVAVLYCFLNAEVRQCIRRRYERIMLRRSTGGAIANMRSRGSRTSTMFLSQSDVALAITFRNKFMSRKSRNGGECDKTPPDPVPPSPPTSNGLGRDDVITPTRPNTYMLDIDADVENNDYYSPIADERL